MTADRKLRVLVLSRSYPNDVLPTLGLWVERPTRLLAERFDMSVVSPVPWCPPVPDAGPMRQYARFRRIPVWEHRGNVDVTRPRFFVGPGTSLYRFEARAYLQGVRRAIDKLHRTEPFDLVHAHFIYPDGVVAHALASRLKIPFVVTEHAPWTGWLDRPGIRRQALAAACDAAALMPVSSSVERTVRAYVGARVRTEVIPVGVDESTFRPSANTRRRPGQVLFVGLINYMKGIDVLLDAVRRLGERGTAIHLLLAGGGHYRDTRLQEEKLRELAHSLQLDGRVRFLGKQSPENVARLMRESAVVVLPSRAESFGSVLVEALACGTPVVATRCGGPEDIVIDEVGVLVPPESPEDLADAIEHVLENGSAYDPRRLHEHALSRFGLRVVADRVAEVYATVLKDAP